MDEPVGWIVGLVGAVLTARRHEVSADEAQADDRAAASGTGHWVTFRAKSNTQTHSCDRQRSSYTPVMAEGLGALSMAWVRAEAAYRISDLGLIRDIGRWPS
jgi:hypothetical protein